MNNKGIKFLTLAFALALAACSIIVIESSTEAYAEDIDGSSTIAHATATYANPVGALSGKSGELVLKAAGADIGLIALAGDVTITSGNEGADVGSLYINANKHSVTITGVTFNAGGLMILDADDVTISNCTFGATDARLVGANAYFAQIYTDAKVKTESGGPAMIYDGNGIIYVGHCAGAISISSNEVFAANSNSSQGISLSSWSNSQFAESISISNNVIDGTAHNAIQIDYCIGSHGHGTVATESVSVSGNTISNCGASAVRMGIFENMIYPAGSIVPYEGDISVTNNTLLLTNNSASPKTLGNFLKIGDAKEHQEALTNPITFSGNKIGSTVDSLTTIPSIEVTVEEATMTYVDYDTMVADTVSKNTIFYGSLIIPESKTLTVNESKTLKNYGTISVEGTLTKTGTITNNGHIHMDGGSLTGEGTLNGTNAFVEYPVTLAASPNNGGKFTDGTSTAYGAEFYAHGNITIVAVPNDGFEFTYWDDDHELAASRSVTVDSAKALTATFSSVKPSFTVTFMDDATPLSTQSVESGKMAVKPADPTKDNNRFTGWYTTNPNTDLQAKKYDFAQPVTKSFELYAGWNAICTVSVPTNVEGKFTTDHPGDNEVNLGTTHTFVLTVTPLGDHVITVAVSNGDLSHDGNVWTIANIDSNVSVSISATKDGVKETKTEQKIENVDGSVTESTVTTTESAGAATVIGESAKTGDAEAVTTTATVSATEAKVDVGAADKNAVITETMSDAIREAVATSGAAANSLTVEVTAAAADTVSLPKDLLHNEKVDKISVTLEGATIVMPKTAVAAGDMADTISLSVTDAGQAPAAAIPEGATATEAFDLTLGGSNTTQFVGTVKVTLTMELPAGATNVKFLCVGGEGAGQSYNASAVTGDSVSGDLPHFSTWTIIFTLPADADVFDDDELPPTWYYVPQQQSASSHTTMIVAACAAAVAAIAVALVMLNVVRKN